MLERDGASKYLALSVDEAVEALWAAYQFEETSNLRFDVFSDILKLLRGDDDSTTCIWNACDPWTTPAVQGIGAQGERYLCQRVNKDGRPFVDAPSGPLVRQLVLASTSQDGGGCQGCRFLAICKGNCPGTAIVGDWRKRTVDCELWLRLFERLEAQLVAAGEQPVSRRPDLAEIEARLAAAWRSGRHLPIKQALQGVGWEFTKKRRNRKRKKSAKRRSPLKQSSLRSWGEASRRSKRQRDCALRSTATRSALRVSIPISSKSSRTTTMTPGLRWKNWQRPIHPGNWQARLMAYMKSSVLRSRRARRVGEREASWIWTTSARWLNKTKTFRVYTRKARHHHAALFLSKIGELLPGDNRLVRRDDA